MFGLSIPFANSSGVTAASGGWGNGMTGGDWNVNVAGSGRSVQGASSAAPPANLMVYALIAGAAWLLLKK